MNISKNTTTTIINLDFISIVMLWVSLFLLSIVALKGNLAPISLFFIMIAFSSILIIIFSNKNEIFFKIKLFIFFFSLYLSYSLINHYILLELSPHKLPFNYADGEIFYIFSDFGVPYISGKKNFFDLFSIFKIHELPLHVVFSSTIAYFSNQIDGSNTIITQKMLSPFLGGMLSVVLYSTLKYQFKDTLFAFNATFAYSLLSAVFMYSIPLLRDIDVALSYMIFIYLFLQPNSYKSFFLLVLAAFITTYIRVESGLLLYGVTLIYMYLYIRKVNAISIKFIFYIFLVMLFTIIIVLEHNRIMGMIVGLNEGNIERSIKEASSGSIGVLLNKLPFPLSYVAKVLFGQIQPFPLFKTIDRPPEAISGVFWPFVFMLMLYAMIKKNIRNLIDVKVKYLFIVAITVLFLMSSEPMARRMMSVYPIIYITSLYVFFIVPNNKIKKIFIIYLFSLISLNTFYYILKI